MNKHICIHIHIYIYINNLHEYTYIVILITVRIVINAIIYINISRMAPGLEDTQHAMKNDTARHGTEQLHKQKDTTRHARISNNDTARHVTQLSPKRMTRHGTARQ